ncbi:MAG TPA: metallophosphoesterase [Thermoanaerobaculia bacterium]|nr:metallophosphoesterase [Thermoanaerobaculia bacterium]
MIGPTRRDVLALSTATAAGLLLPTGGAFAAARAQRAKRDRRPKADFAVAFLTDMHVDGELGSADGFAKAVRNAFDRPQPPEVLVTGGDLVMDILETGADQADALYALFEKQIAGVKVPTHHTMGNHDMLGVYEKSGLQPDHPKYGKKYFFERFKQDHAYHSFDHEGWHFVILDSLGIEGRGYIGWVDDEQLVWLEDDLAASAKPTVVFTHVPLWSNYIEINRGIADPIPRGVAIVNAHKVAPILQKNKVKLVLAGHLHINETFTYKGIEYSTVGAVSGNWWKGARDGFEEGYARLEFRGDQVSWEYVDYGWEAQPATPATATAA